MYGSFLKQIHQMVSKLNEKQLRQYLGSKGEALGRGGIAMIARISGKSGNTIVAGIKENKSGENDNGRIRKPGGGRKPITVKYPVLKMTNYEVGYDTVSCILKELGYSLQWNQKILQIGKQHPDRAKQFQFINSKAKKFLRACIPVISIDAKKKENIGNFINNGRLYRKKKNPVKVLDHDFAIKELWKVIPYGVYDIDT